MKGLILDWPHVYKNIQSKRTYAHCQSGACAAITNLLVSIYVRLASKQEGLRSMECRALHNSDFVG